MKAARNDLPKKPILVVKAPAKINLGLKVVRRRSDGFHDIVSLCQTVNLCDTLEFYADRIDSMCCTDKNLNHPENLVYQALRLFRARNGQCNYQPVHILLKKAIPIGAGLGGGSADAATGRIATWDSSKTIKLQAREYNGSYAAKLHSTRYWDGIDSSHFSLPTLTITAIS